MTQTSQKIQSFFEKYVPSPFSIAIILTIIVIICAVFYQDNVSFSQSIIDVLQYWENGIWNEGLLVFAYQMMLILVLGHILVLSKPMQNLLDYLTRPLNSTSKAVLVVSISTMLMAFLNWGLGLIFGAILVKKIGDNARKNNIKLNYPLIGAAGYIGLMVWHGGMSGSAPLKVSETKHLTSLTSLEVPDFIGTSETIFSIENLTIFALLLTIMPILFLILSKKSSVSYSYDKFFENHKPITKHHTALNFESSSIPAISFGILLIIAFVIQYHENLLNLRITPNMINLFMLGISFILHSSFLNFINALKEAISDVSGILIQFPLYFGIMGVMKDSGLAVGISDFFVSISTAKTLPVFSFISAGILNIFVPSGGGQWAIQGPILIETSTKLGVPLPKMIMAMSYGDQITNMLQPFWALPLLAIARLKAYQILPYTFLMFVVGTLVFLFGLLFIY